MRSNRAVIPGINALAFTREVLASSMRLPQDDVPHGEERGNAARLEPSGVSA